jgi:hypothetical protein
MSHENAANAARRINSIWGPFLALQTLALLALAVVFNLGLFLIVGMLTSRKIIQGGSFPALVVFLSFALSVGIILIAGLGERINTSAISNQFVKRFGVTPIMVIVAVLLAMFGSFIPASHAIFPNAELELMLTGIDFSCNGEQKHPAQATALLTLISSDDRAYIKSITEILQQSSPEAFVRQRTRGEAIHLVEKTTSNDTYKLILNRASADKWSWDVSGPEKWVAYTIAAQPPGSQTPLPIPVRFKTPHVTRIFVLVKQAAAATDKNPEADAVSPTVQEVKDIWPLMTIGITPQQPEQTEQRTDFDVQVFAHPDHICWHVPT